MHTPAGSLLYPPAAIRKSSRPRVKLAREPGNYWRYIGEPISLGVYRQGPREAFRRAEGAARMSFLLGRLRLAGFRLMLGVLFSLGLDFLIGLGGSRWVFGAGDWKFSRGIWKYGISENMTYSGKHGFIGESDC